jgi:hypothetical protein
MPAPRDPEGQFRMRLRSLAVDAGLAPGALIDEWTERAQVLEWSGTPSPESERVALMHIEERLGC